MPKFFSKKQVTPPSRREVARMRHNRQDEDTNKPTANHAVFQRSRTMTGSISSRIRSPGEDTAHLTSPRVRAHHLTKIRRHIWLALAIVIIIGAFLMVTLSQFTAGVTVTIDGDVSIQPQSDYQATIEKYFGQAPIERLRFLTNNQNLTQYLQRTHPEVAQAVVDGASGIGGSDVSITMRQPVVEWSVNDTMQYVDAGGIPFQANYFASPRVKIIDKSGIRLPAGQTLFSNAFLSFVGRVVGTAKSLESATITKIVIPPNTTAQIEVYVSGVPYPAKFSIDRGAGEQIEDMTRAEHWFKKHGVTPHYIDVRVSGEAYYR